MARGLKPGGGPRRRVSGAQTSICVESGKQNRPGGKRSNWPGLARYSGMGAELAGSIVGLTLAGLWIDHQFGTGRKGVITGAAIGLVGGFYNFLRHALEMSRRQQAATKDRKADRGDDKNR